MKHARWMQVGFLTTVLLTGLAAGMVAQDEPSDPMAAALATGDLTFVDAVDFAGVTESNGLVEERGRTMRFQSEMSDPRLSGDVVVVDDADRFFQGDPSLERFLGDLLWGTIEITNDDGTWTGTKTGITDAAADGRGVQFYELVGGGGYDGLSAVILERESGPDLPAAWSAQILPGALPPDR